MTKTTPEPKKTKSVLIIEDEGDMCLLLNIILSGKEFELDHVKNLSDAKNYLLQSPPAVVLLDNKLPDGYGIDFIPFLKATYPAVKIVMLSGFDKAARDQALAAGADVYLEKPFTKTQVHDAIMQVLQAQPAAS